MCILLDDPGLVSVFGHLFVRHYCAFGVRTVAKTV